MSITNSPFRTHAQPIKALTVLLGLLAVIPVAGFGSYSGAKLQSDCIAMTKPGSETGTEATSGNQARTHPPAFCDGYIQGISESQNGMGFCRRTAADRSVSFERDAILGYLAQHPERLQEPAHGLVLDALRHAFPCLH